MKSAEITSVPKKWISNAQLFFLMVVIRNVVAISITPAITAGYSRQDVWITIGIATIANFVFIWFYINIHRRLPTLKLEQLSDVILGKYLGKVATSIFFIYFFVIAIALTAFIAHMNQSIIPETPRAVIQWSFLIVCLYSLYRGPASMVQLSGLFFIFTFVLKLSVLVLLIPELDISEFKPILYYGWTPVLVGVIVPTVLFLESLFILHLLPMVKTTKWTYRIPYLAHIVAGGFLLSLSTLLVTVFGAVEAEKLQFPLFTLVRSIAIGDFLERLEFIVVGSWYASIFLAVTMYLYVCRELLLHMIKRLNKHANYVNIGLVLAVGIIVPRRFPDMQSLLQFYDVEMYGLFGFLIAGVLPVVLYIIMRIRKKGV